MLILAGLVFNRERKSSRREPGFTPPDASTGVSYANVYTGQEDERYDTEPKPNDDPVGQRPAAYDPPTSSYGYGNQPAQVQVQEQRASVDAYGTAGDRTSRTMQLAYSDPCKHCHLIDSGIADTWLDAAIRANLATDPYSYDSTQQSGSYAQPTDSYSQPPATYGMPNPPQYGGYR